SNEGAPLGGAVHVFQLWTPQRGSAGRALGGGDFEKALGAITAKAILVPCTDDLYFPPEDNEIEAEHMPNADFRPFASPWGHCVPSPGNVPEFHTFLDNCIRELLNE
ncbi:MAG: hypothetical protein AAF441_19205, partial [Pseudomonadota bacterium]